MVMPFRRRESTLSIVFPDGGTQEVTIPDMGNKPIPYAVPQLITPEWAKELLEERMPNRRISSLHVRRLKNAVLGDKWQLTHQGIALTPPMDTGDGKTKRRLLDGMHRAQMIRELDKALPMMVSYNALPETFPAIDDMRKRTLGDDLAARGFINAKHAGSVVNLLMRYEDALHKNWVVQRMGAASPYPKALQEDFATNLFDVDGGDGSISPSLVHHWAKKLYQAPIWVSQAAAGAFYVLLRLEGNYEDADLEEFFERVGEGLGLTKGSPEHAVRKYISNLSPERGEKSPGYHYLVVLIMAFNAARRGETDRNQFKVYPDRSKVPRIIPKA